MDEKAQMGIDLEKEVQHTPNEIMQQMIDALIVAVHNRLMSGDTAATVVEITRELIHWSFSRPGAHGTPADLLAQTLDMVKTNDVFRKEPGGKPKIDG